MIKITDFTLLKRQVHRLGANPQELERRAELERGGIVVSLSQLIIGKEAIYWLTPGGGVTKVVIHVPAIDMHKGDFSGDAKKLFKSFQFDCFKLLDELPSFHFLPCDLLQRATREGAIDDLCVSRRTDGRFRFRFMAGNKLVLERENQLLRMCHSCAHVWKGMKSGHGNEGKDRASAVIEFFELPWDKRWIVGVYSSDRLGPPGIYPADWQLIERCFRERVEYRCEDPLCEQSDLSEPLLRKYLRCSWKGLSGSEDTYWMLQAVCIRCYAEWSGFENLKKHPDYVDYQRLLKS